MSKLRRSCELGLGIWLLAAAGCDSGEAESVRVKECRNVCQKRDMCLSDTDLADCEQRCDEQEFRSDLYYQLKGQCVSDGRLSCDQWAGELDIRGEDVCLGADCALDECVHRKLLEHELTEEQQESCEDMASGLFNCNHDLPVDELEATCKRTLLEVSPEYVEESGECTKLRCVQGNEYQQCFDDLALKYSTEIRLFGL